MSVAENVTVQIRHHAPRRPHAAVAAQVGGPYPNLVAPAPGLPIDLRRVGEAGLAAGGPYPNLWIARR